MVATNVCNPGYSWREKVGERATAFIYVVTVFIYIVMLNLLPSRGFLVVLYSHHECLSRWTFLLSSERMLISLVSQYMTFIAVLSSKRLDYALVL